LSPLFTGKERDLYVPMNILELETLEDLLRHNNALTDKKKRQFERFRAGLVKLSRENPLARYKDMTINLSSSIITLMHKK
jgi:hypothetical protein